MNGTDPISLVLKAKQHGILAITPDKPVYDALSLMAEHHIGALMVIEAGGKLVGMIVAGLVITGLITIGYLFVFNSFFNDVNVAMFQAQLLVMASVIPMCAIALLISVLIPENLAPLFTAVAIWFSFSVTKLSNLQYVYGGILPDLNLYNIRAEASYGVPVAWSYFSLVILWGLVFAIFSTSIASMIFSQKDLK